MLTEHDVPGGIAKRTSHFGPYLRENANELHSDLARRQSFDTTLTLRLDEGAHHISPSVGGNRRERWKIAGLGEEASGWMTGLNARRAEEKTSVENTREGVEADVNLGTKKAKGDRGGKIPVMSSHREKPLRGSFALFSSPDVAFGPVFRDLYLELGRAKGAGPAECGVRGELIHSSSFSQPFNL